jgi:hypothetical protein
MCRICRTNDCGAAPRASSAAKQEARGEQAQPPGRKSAQDRGRGVEHRRADRAILEQPLVSWLKLEYVVSPPMSPIVMAERSVAGQDSTSAACMMAAIAKQPTRLTINVPWGRRCRTAARPRGR